MFSKLIGYLKLNWFEPDIYLQNNTVIRRLNLINDVRVFTYVSFTYVYFLDKLCKLYEILSLP